MLAGNIANGDIMSAKFERRVIEKCHYKAIKISTTPIVSR